jgi:hypothetical protein
MGSGLRAIVEAEHRFDNSIQLLRELNDTLSASEDSSLGMLAALQSNSERSLKLGHGAGERHSATRRVLLYDTQAMTGRERLDCGDIRGIRAVMARKFISRQVP